MCMYVCVYIYIYIYTCNILLIYHTMLYYSTTYYTFSTRQAFRSEPLALWALRGEHFDEVFTANPPTPGLHSNIPA